MRTRATTFISICAAGAAAAAATLLLAPGAGAGPAPLDLVVTTTDWGGAFAVDGACSDPCSLREAVAEADANPGGGNITFAVDGTIVLQTQLELDQGGVVSITGNGVVETVLDADAVDRHFYLTNGSELHLDGMTLQNGEASFGGSIWVNNGAELSTQDVHFVDNTAVEGGSGGAIFAGAGGDTVDIRSTTFTGNAAGAGGAIFIDHDVVTVSNSTFTANEASSGSAIWVHAHEGLASLRVDYSTFSQNLVSDRVAEERAQIQGFRSMRSSAAAPQFGGGGDTQGTIVGQVGEDVADVIISNSILEKTTGLATDECGGNVQSGGGNIVDDDSCNFAEALDQEEVAADVGPLQDNGGPTFTMALAASSAAVDVDPALCELNDQRDLPRNVDGNGDGTEACDSGAYELQPAPTTTAAPTPTTTDDGVAPDTATPAAPTVVRPTFTG